MIEWGALAMAVIQLIASILDDRRATRPEREAKAERKDVLGDVDRLNQAIRDKDSAGVAAFFEDERREALGRVPDASESDGVHPAGRDDSGQPAAQAAPERTVGRD